MLRKKRKIWLWEAFLASFVLLLMLCSGDALALASRGLLIWYQNMIPSLFPFMVLSGFLVNTGMSAALARPLKPLAERIFPLPEDGLYAILMGFFCGFPMGAKVTADLLAKNRISPGQGELLLAFCNNIGPLYMLGYVIPLFGWENGLTVFGVMYGAPLAYGFVLLRLYDRQCHQPKTSLPKGWPQPSMRIGKAPQMPESRALLPCFQQALSGAIDQITLLGGCMVFFNCLQLYPQKLSSLLPGKTGIVFREALYAPLCCLLEIGGGLERLAAQTDSLWALGFITFGGLSCILQTAFLLKNTPLSMGAYVKHKLIQSALVFLLLYFS